MAKRYIRLSYAIAILKLSAISLSIGNSGSSEQRIIGIWHQKLSQFLHGLLFSASLGLSRTTHVLASRTFSLSFP
ncbi:hypothetical protein [Moorena producens]|uniref:hypothetical protein n=1 Tax=Moorena producens TaxID=1155739 RepID=UPI003C731237